MSELRAEQIAGPLNARQAAYVQGINESGEHLLYVIDNILGYTHLLSGKLQLRCELCELGYLLHVCAISQRAKAEAKQQVIEEAVEPAWLSVESDVEALGGVLKRLLENAIKFTPTGGRVGLAYVDQMVRLLGGVLAVAPNADGGSCFTITLTGTCPRSVQQSG